MTGGKPLGSAPLKTVVVGAGFVGPMHLRGWRMLESVALSAISSRTRAKAEKLAAEFGIPAVYDGFEEMLDAETASSPPNPPATPCSAP